MTAKRPASLRFRLGIGLAIGLTVMWLAATIASGFVVRHELDETFDSALQETAQRILSLAVESLLDSDATTSERRIGAIGPHEEFLTYVVRDRAGSILLRSHDANPDIFPKKPVIGFLDTETHRIYGESAVSGTFFIEVAEPLSHRREAAMDAVLGLFSPLPLLIGLSLVCVWWFVQRSMRPVIELQTQIEARGGGDLSPVESGTLPIEIANIADSVNRLMSRLRRVLEAERSFTANSAHELRTPIAAALAQTQRLIAEAPDGTMGERARRIETSMHQLARLSEKLMQLARAEGGGLLAETPQDLGPILAYVVDEFRRIEEDAQRLDYTQPDAAGPWSHMDPDAFAILMRNLIENALKYGPAGTPVEITLTTDGEARVVNAGPVVPPETLAGLKERFTRGGSEAKGSGLGLAIADAVATGAGATLELISPARGRDDGFEARVTLPLSPPPGPDAPTG